MVLYILFVAAMLCIPVAYAMGQITGSEAMRREILSHPSMRKTKPANQFRRTA